MSGNKVYDPVVISPWFIHEDSKDSNNGDVYSFSDQIIICLSL